MVFWSRSKTPLTPPPPPTPKSGKGAGSSSVVTPRRVDNIRLLRMETVTIRSVGTTASYSFLTKDISASGIFLLCRNPDSYPFLDNTTLLDVTLHLTGHREQAENCHCLAKIVRRQIDDKKALGLALRIIQIQTDQRHLLETWISTMAALVPDQTAVQIDAPFFPPKIDASGG